MYRGSYTHSIAAELAEDCPGRSEGEEREDVAVATGTVTHTVSLQPNPLYTLLSSNTCSTHRKEVLEYDYIF